MPFRAYQPDLNAFPLALWTRLAARRQRLADRTMLAIGDPRGYRLLREAVAADLHRRLKVEVDPGTVLIVPGGKVTMFFAIMMFGQKGTEILYPNPGFPIYESVIKASGATPVPIALKEANCTVCYKCSRECPDWCIYIDAHKETHDPAYLAVKPEGKVPALLIDGRLLTEVAGILFYLAKRYPAANLLPAGDIEAEAQAVSWMSFIAATVHPARRQGLEHARGVYAIVDKRLGNRTWALGDRYSIADIHLFRLFWRFRNSLNPEPGEFPSLAAHYERMMARPAVKKTIEVESAVGYELPP